MNGIEEVAVKVMILCEYCEADACSEAVAEALEEEL